MYGQSKESQAILQLGGPRHGLLQELIPMGADVAFLGFFADGE